MATGTHLKTIKLHENMFTELKSIESPHLVSQIKLTSDGQHLVVSALDTDFTLTLYRTLDLVQVD